MSSQPSKPSQAAARPAPTYTLNDGTALPAVGFGTYPLRGAAGVAAIRSALEVGYRLLDTAVNYENETEVGQAVRESGVPREEVRVTSKVPGRHHGYDDAIASTQASLERLGLDYLDLHLIHWPNPRRDRYVEAWRALVDLRERGLVRSIGVSNFTRAHLERVIEATGVTPAVNQVEMHPLFPQEELRLAHERLGVRTEAWSPLGKREAQYDAPPVRAAAEAHGVTAGQVILRWHHQLGSLPIPKSANRDRQVRNLDVFGFELTPAEVSAITALGRPDGRLFGGDPDTHEEM
jgi:diketogulonate reductase-like aldo/keto reductase